MKPKTPQAMQNLIDQITKDILDKASKKNFCTDSCRGCAIKLLNYLTSEVEGWQQRIDDNQTPTLADINKLAKTAIKINKVVSK